MRAAIAGIVAPENDAVGVKQTMMDDFHTVAVASSHLEKQRKLKVPLADTVAFDESNTEANMIFT